MRPSPDGGPVTDAARPAVARALISVLPAVRLFGFLAWAYIAANSMSHPATMTEHLTHLASWPHENTFGVTAFAASLLAAVTLCFRPSPPGGGKDGADGRQRG